jgi:hypothetical protein
VPLAALRASLSEIMLARVSAKSTAGASGYLRRVLLKASKGEPKLLCAKYMEGS